MNRSGGAACMSQRLRISAPSRRGTCSDASSFLTGSSASSWIARAEAAAASLSWSRSNSTAESVLESPCPGSGWCNGRSRSGGPGGWLEPLARSGTVQSPPEAHHLILHQCVHRVEDQRAHRCRPTLRLPDAGTPSPRRHPTTGHLRAPGPSTTPTQQPAAPTRAAGTPQSYLSPSQK